MNATWRDVLELAQQLPTDEQNLLIFRLRVKQLEARQKASPLAGERGKSDNDPLRESLLRDVEALRAAPVRPDDSLLGKYANPNAPDISEEAFHAQMHSIATEWEAELDDLDRT